MSLNTRASSAPDASDSSNSVDPRLGTVIGERYRVVEVIGGGGMGVVYRADRLRLGSRVAVKFLHDAHAADPLFVRRFETEARALARLSHPHCVSVIDFGVDGAPYIVMEYVSGHSLDDLLGAQTALEPGRALAIGRQILAGLAHAHRHGIVHRDIKPANIRLVEATGVRDHVRILDFGLAKLHGALARCAEPSSPDIAIGTPSYMSPEQTLGEAVDARSDIYAVGVLLFELLAGCKPFVSEDRFALLTMHREAPPPDLREAAPSAHFSAELAAVLQRAMAKAPDDRFASALDMAEALAETREGRAGQLRTTARSLPPVPFSDTARLPAQSGRWGRALRRLPAALSLTAAAGVLGLWLFEMYRPRQEVAAPAAGEVELTARAAAPLPATAPPAANVPRANRPEAAALAPDDGGADGDAGALGTAAPADDSDAGTTDGALADADADAADAAESEADLDSPFDDAGVAEPDELADLAAAVESESAVGEPAASATAAIKAAKPARATAIDLDQIRTTDDVEKLLAQGRREEAVRALRRMRRRVPSSAYVPYLLGNLYFDARWWSGALDEYRAAIKNNRGFRRRATMNRNAVEALGSDRTYRKAAAFLRNDVGRSAAPYLRHAAKNHRSAKTRRRAGALLRKLLSTR